MFDNVKLVEFAERDHDRIIAIESKEGEKVKLDKYVMAVGKVEEWLNSLLLMAKQSVHSIIREAYGVINSANFNLMVFIDSYVSQVSNVMYPVVVARFQRATNSNTLFL